MFEFLAVCFSILFIPLSLRLMKGTFLEVSWQRKGFGGLILGKEVFLLVIPGVVLYSVGAYKNFKYFYVTDESVQEATTYIIYSLYAFCLTFSFICKFVFRGRLLLNKAAPILVAEDLPVIKGLYRITVALMILALLVFLGAGMRHALLASVISGADLLETRLQNRYATGIPTVVMSFFRFLYVLNAILLGLIYARLRRVQKTLGVTLLVFAVSFFGDKAPVFSTLVLIFLAGLSTGARIALPKILKYSFMMGASSLMILYGVSYFQLGGITPIEFLEFLLFRAGFGQIGGVYEEFAIRLQNPAYIWHSVPFANLVLDYPIFNKDLMLMLWGENLNANETGVMNSLFVGEAFAIGGGCSCSILASNRCDKLLPCNFPACDIFSEIFWMFVRSHKNDPSFACAIHICSNWRHCRTFVGEATGNDSDLSLRPMVRVRADTSKPHCMSSGGRAKKI